MGFDELRDKAGDFAGEHSDKVEEGVDRAAEFADEKTGGQYGEHIEGGADKAKDFVGGLSGEGDSGDGSEEGGGPGEETGGMFGQENS